MLLECKQYMDSIVNHSKFLHDYRVNYDIGDLCGAARTERDLHFGKLRAGRSAPIHPP
jgi:hypothetical protein